jgi:hypothetical protein
MNLQEATEALLRSSSLGENPSKGERRHAVAISQALDCLPVALVQAGSFIRIHHCIGTYLNKLKQNREKVMRTKALDQRDQHHHCVYDTLDIVYPALSERAQMLLGILSFMDYNGFPPILLHRAASLNFLHEPMSLIDRSPEFEASVQTLRQVFMPDNFCDQQVLDDLISELERYSLVTRMERFKTTILRMHGLVNSWAKDKLRAQGAKGRKCHEAVIRLLICGTNEDNEDIYEFLMPHFSLFAPLWHSFHVNDRVGVINLLLHEGKTDDALQIAKSVYNNVYESSGEDVVCRSNASLLLAKVYWRSADVRLQEEAAEMEMFALTSLRDAFSSENDPIVIRAAAQVSVGLFRQQQYQQAEELQRSILRSLEAIGETGELALQSMEALATTYSSPAIAKYNEAAELLTYVYDKRHSPFGMTWRATNTASRLAELYHTMMWNGTTDRAALKGNTTSLWNQIVQAREDQKGPGHLDTINAKHAQSISRLLFDSDVFQASQDLIAVFGGSDFSNIFHTIRNLILGLDNGLFPRALQALRELTDTESKREPPYYTNNLEEKHGIALRSYILRDADAKTRILEILCRYANSSDQRLGDDLLRVARYWAQWPFGPEREMGELLKAREDEYGTTDDYVLGLKELLATYYILQPGRESKGFSAWKDLAESRRRAYGATHPETLQIQEAVNFALKAVEKMS